MSRAAIGNKVVMRSGTRVLPLLHWRHGLILLGALFASVAWASGPGDPTGGTLSPLATLVRWVPFILKGFGLNLVISVFAMAVGTLLGVAVGLMQISRRGAIRGPAWFVTHLFRNSPWIVILFVVMNLLPFEIPWPDGGTVLIPPWLPAAFAFSLPIMANVSEIVRGAVNSIPHGQWESGESLAFSRGQVLRWVILPQCIRRSLPPWMNWYALLTLATPIASIVGVQESLGNVHAAMEAAGGRPDLLMPFYLFLLCLFFAYIYPIAIFTRRLENRYGFIS